MLSEGTNVNTTTQLEQARALHLPERQAMLRRDPSVQKFWSENQELLHKAWEEWDAADIGDSLGPSLLDPKLRAAVETAWQDPSRESAVRDLMTEPSPGVFSFQFFDPEQLQTLRSYLEAVWDAGIPIRPPYGIVLNRQGAMLDLRSEGAIGAPSFQAFYRMLIDTYMRPIARLVYPEIVGYDSQAFGFSINYQPTTDTSIRPHSDASAVTLNINVNLPDESFTGSNVDFLDPASGDVASLRFEPGSAMIHRGGVPHMAHPITTGERTNLVLWLFGEGGRMPVPEQTSAQIDPRERWTVPTTPQDQYAPF